MKINSIWGFGGGNCLSLMINGEIDERKRTYPKGISNATLSQRGSFSTPETFDTFGYKSM